MNENYEKVRLSLEDIVNRRFTNLSASVKADFIKVVFSIRFLVSISQTQLETIWRSIRINDQLVDFILDSTRELLVRSFNEEYSYEKLCGEINGAYSIISDPRTAIDKDLLVNIDYRNKTIEEIYSNPWFVFLYLCESTIVLEEDND